MDDVSLDGGEYSIPVSVATSQSQANFRHVMSPGGLSAFTQ